jgi:hypothetical protein
LTQKRVDISAGVGDEEGLFGGTAENSVRRISVTNGDDDGNSVYVSKCGYAY